MSKTTSISELKNAIRLLETEQEIKKQLLIEQIHITVESLKPVNLIKNALVDIAESPFLVEHILSTGIGMATGYISKKVVIGASGNLFRKLMGNVLQFGVANIVARHPDMIKTYGQYIIQHVFHRKEKEINS